MMILSRLKAHRGLGLVLLLYFGLSLMTSLRAPLDTGPDEVAHFMLARFILTEQYLPFTAEDRKAAGYKSDQPPLNALIVASTFFWGDVDHPPFAKLTRDVPRRYLADNVDNFAAWRVLTTEDPMAGELLFWYVGRWLSIIFSGATLVVIYRTALIIFEDAPQQRLLALSTVSSVAFIPTFILVSSVLSYEALLGFWLSLYLLAAVVIFKRGVAAWLYFAAGLCAGLAIVAKLSALPILFSLVGLIIVTGRRLDWSCREWLQRFGLSLAGLLLGAGWWFALVVIQLNRIDDLGWMAGLIQPIFAGDGSDTTSADLVKMLVDPEQSGALMIPDPLAWRRWLRQLFETFWSLRVILPQAVIVSLVGLSLLALLGLGRGWRQQRDLRPWLTLLGLHCLLFFIFPFIRFVMTGPQTAKGQHILFPAVGAWALLFSLGLNIWLRPLRPWLGGLLLGIGLSGLSLFQLTQIYQPPLPVQTVSTANLNPSIQPIEADFGPMALNGYKLEEAIDHRSALSMSLYWTAEELADQDYLTEVELVNKAGQTATLWVGHPADGRYPSRAWEPGDHIRDQIWLPVAGLEPGSYTLELSLLGKQGPIVVDGHDEVVLTEIQLAESYALPKPDSSASEAQIAYLWQQGAVQEISLEQMIPALPHFQSQSTIQITSPQPVNLVGPDQISRKPIRVADQTHIFVVDLDWPAGEYRLSMQAADQQSTFETHPILFAQGKGRKMVPPESQFKVEANFANQLKLLGYNLPRDRFIPGEELPLTLHLQAIDKMPADFIMFVRLRDETGQVWAAADRRPQGVYSTLFWAQNEVVEDGFTLTIDEMAPPGRYYLDLGFYLPVGQAAVSLPLMKDGSMQDITSVTIGPIVIGSKDDSSRS